MTNMEFEFDKDKAKENLTKHGVSFEEAMTAFDDDNAVEIYDELNSDEEIRFQIIALSPFRLLFVVYTVRESETGEIIRIISARKADVKQINIYNEYNGE